MEHSALQYSLEAELRPRRVVLARCRYPPQSVGGDVMPEIRAELIEVGAASLKHLAHGRGIDNREQ